MMKPSTMKIRSLALSVLVITVCVPTSSRAQSRALFSDQLATSSSSASTLRTGEPAIIRSRRASADVSVLAEAPRAGGDLNTAMLAARSVDLNLFTNVELVAQLDRVETVAPLGYAWVGEVAGVENSEVVLAVSDGVLTGSISVPGRVYSVRQVGSSYEIAEINTQLIPGDEVVLPVLERAASFRANAATTASETGDTFDLLICYTSATKRAAGGAAAVNSLATASVAQVNSLYAASGITTRVRLVGAIETAYAESGSAATDLAAVHADAGIRAARDAYAADIVSVLVSTDPVSSGSGYVSVSRGQSFSDLGYNVTVYYPYLGYIYSLAHEIGHNQGALHEPGNNAGDDTRGAYPYSVGFTDAKHGFYDVMSYGRGCTNCTRLSQFSSPVASYRGNPVGSASQDSARTVNNTRLSIANYRTAARDTASLQPPSGLAASVSGTSVSLTWTAPSGTAVTSYIVEVGSAPGLSNLASVSTGTTATSFTTAGVESGTYYLRVKAVSAAGTSAASNEAKLVVGGGTCAALPTAPAGFAVTTNTRGTVSFVWNASAGASTYVIESGSTPGSSDRLAAADLGGPATSYTASGVGAGTYYVRLRARNACGTSGASNEVLLVVK
jgi:hypothetical protein